MKTNLDLTSLTSESFMSQFNSKQHEIGTKFHVISLTKATQIVDVSDQNSFYKSHYLNDAQIHVSMTNQPFDA